jgi:phospholipase C
MPDEHSDAALSRREFLERTAYAAGLAGAASILPVETIISEAAQAATRRNPLPSPRNVEIDHFVILMMENRSYDHYFGWLTDVSDAKQHQTYRNIVGQPVATRHASWMGRAEWQGCDHPDPGHGWDAGRAQLNGGFLAQGSGNDEFALSYYNKGELPAIHAAAENYTLYDRYFCSILCSTWPNRYYKWSAQSGGIINNNPPVASVGNQWDTIFDVALRKPGLTARYYQSDLPFSAVWGPRAVPWTHNVQEYYQDAAAGRLPNISIIDPPFRDGGGFEGMSADEHPLGDVRLGQAFMADVVNAFVRSPNYRRGALFVIYDEWGGFFDHVRPPRVVDGRMSRDLNKDFGQMGFRIPAVTVSPYSRPKKKKGFRVDHGVYGHESILKLISYRFGLPFLNKRHRYARNIGSSFDWKDPDFTPPRLPDPPVVATAPCETGGGGVFDGGDSHASDLADLEHLADRFGFKVLDQDVFSMPDSVRRAIRKNKARERARAHSSSRSR